MHRVGDGEKVASFSIVRVNGPVTACALSEDINHALMASGNGFLFTYKLINQNVDDFDQL